MRVDPFDFDLPPERIALRPAVPRDSARMLVVGADGALARRARLATCRTSCGPGDALVVNDTRVIAARLDGIRVRGEAVASIEATLIKRVDDSRWRALVRPAKKLKVGERIRFGEDGESMACLLALARRRGRGEGRRRAKSLLAFAFAGAALDEAIERLGQTPLPPYIAARRAPERAGPRRLPDDLRRRSRRGRGADRGAAFHRRAGRPHRGDAARASIASRCMSAPARFCPSRSRIRATTRCTPNGAASTRRPPRRSTQRATSGGRIVASGRPRLASARKRGGRSAAASAPFAGETSIFITPGYRFRAVDVLMTNFHLPRSTLFMLVGAFSGLETMRARLRPRDRRGLSLLLLRRRLPADRRLLAKSGRRRDSEAFSFSRRAPSTAPPGSAQLRRRAASSARPPSCRSARRRRSRRCIPSEVRALGADIVLGNTYHLMLRPARSGSPRSAACTSS